MVITVYLAGFFIFLLALHRRGLNAIVGHCLRAIDAHLFRLLDPRRTAPDMEYAGGHPVPRFSATLGRGVG